jgi:hypothetical protein
MNTQLSFQLVQLGLKFLFDVGTQLLSPLFQNKTTCSCAGGNDYLPNLLRLALVGQRIFNRLTH